MPKNKGAGGNKRRKGKGTSERDMVFKTFGQDYAQVNKSLGNGYIEVTCFTDNQVKRAHIRGNMRKKVWLSVGDIVLVSHREFETATVDITLKYTNAEIRLLKSQKQLPHNIEVKDDTGQNDRIMFIEGSEEEEEEEEYINTQKTYDLPSSDDSDSTDSDIDISKL